jgi:hypothetical protein
MDAITFSFIVVPLVLAAVLVLLAFTVFNERRPTPNAPQAGDSAWPAPFAPDEGDRTPVGDSPEHSTEASAAETESDFPRPEVGGGRRPAGPR